MTWSRYIRGLGFGAFVFGFTLALVVIFISPERGYFAFSSFFLSFFLFLVCLFTVLGFYGRRSISNNEVLYLNLKAAFRQGTIFALYCTFLLIMKAADILNFWNGILMGASVIFLDMFFKEKL